VLVIRWVVGSIGVAFALATLGSAIRTVVVPRGEQVFITRTLFIFLRWIFHVVAVRMHSWESHDRMKARMAPMGLMLLPAVWATAVISSFSLVFWALENDTIGEAWVLSGSSLTTLGFRTAASGPGLAAAIVEGLIGLGLVGLMISFLPTIYSAFSRRESPVAKLFLRASDRTGHVSPSTLLTRVQIIDGLDQMPQLWSEWEDWFVDIEESHTSFPMLVFFRSPVTERSWVGGAGLALDTASLYVSTLDLPRAPRAELMIRTGTLALRRISDYFAFDYDKDPAPDDPIAIERCEYEEVYEALKAAGLPVLDDRDAAWRKFAGWRVNYDQPLLQLASFVDAPPALWSSDRSVAYRRPTVIRRRH